MKAAILLFPLALAACGSKPTVSADNASVAEVRAKIEDAGQAEYLSPGRWESTVRIDKVDVPGIPAEIAQRMRAAMKTNTTSKCLSPEEAKKPAAEFFAGKDRKDCRYDHFRMGDGVLDAKMTCGSGGSSAAIAMKGTYHPDSFNLAMTVDGKGMAGTPQGAMTMAMTVDSRRTGACTGKEASGR